MGNKRVQIRHGKATYLGGVIGSAIMLLFGLFVVIPMTSSMGRDNMMVSHANIPGLKNAHFEPNTPVNPVARFGKAFGIIWTLAAAGGLAFSLYNLLAEKSVSLMEMDVVNDPDSTSATSTRTVARTSYETPSTETRLRELEALRDKGLITMAEYAEKREEILRSI